MATRFEEWEDFNMCLPDFSGAPRGPTVTLKYEGEMNETQPSEPSAQGGNLDSSRFPTRIYTHSHPQRLPSTYNKARVLNVARRYLTPAPNEGVLQQLGNSSEAKHLEAIR